MKFIIVIPLFLVLFSGTAVCQTNRPDWKEFDNRPVAEWYKDAKFGIFITWGVYSVPAFAPKGNYAEWYQFWLQQKSFKGAVADYHQKVYGDKTYYQLANDFKAELFNPDEWAALFEKSGARYIVPVAKHHDGFTWWYSKEANEHWGFPWNATEVGPKRDLLGDLLNAVRKTSVKPGVYCSLYEWYNPLYKKNPEQYALTHAIPQMKELITKYKPYVLWTDGDWDDSDTTWHSVDFLNWLYHESPMKDSIVTYDRWGKGIRFKHGNVYTPEYQPDMDFGDHYFEESRGIGFSYGYNRVEDSWDYNSSQTLILLLSDLVSRGGNFLLNVGPDRHGKIPPVMQERLLDIGAWLKTNGEAIYNTRKWKQTCQWSAGRRDYKPVREEGDFKANGDFILKQTVDPPKGYAAKEAFFTYNPKTNNLYVILPKRPAKNQFVLKGIVLPKNTVVRWLSANQPLKWKVENKNTIIQLPALNTTESNAQAAYSIKIENFGK